MQNRIDRHTKFVAWAKIILPILALGILSTLFLLSRSLDPVATLPFTQDDINARTKGEQISEPEVFGVTSGGDFISLKAAYARRNDEDQTLGEAESVTAQIKLTSGVTMDITAKHAQQHEKDDSFTLSQNVTAQTSSGYAFETEKLTLSVSHLTVESEGAVKGQGPEGQISAGKMILDVPKGEKDAHIILKDGVKLLYRPQEIKD